MSSPALHREVGKGKKKEKEKERLGLADRAPALAGRAPSAKGKGRRRCSAFLFEGRRGGEKGGGGKERALSLRFGEVLET